MLFVSGDVHGNMREIQRIIDWAKNQNLTKNDYLVLLGDFLVPKFKNMSKEYDTFDFWEKFPCQVLFVDGNHENFEDLNKMPIETWNGGLVHKVGNNILHLMRGQVFTIDGHKIFTMGGAKTIDRHRRIEGVDWFREEDISYNETNIALDNLAKVNNVVDYIFTHTVGKEFISKKINKTYESPDSYSGSINNFLDYINDIINYKDWYFGHFHFDEDFEETNLHCVYKNVIRLF